RDVRPGPVHEAVPLFGSPVTDGVIRRGRPVVLFGCRGVDRLATLRGGVALVVRGPGVRVAEGVALVVRGPGVRVAEGVALVAAVVGLRRLRLGGRRLVGGLRGRVVAVVGDDVAAVVGRPDGELQGRRRRVAEART